MALAGACAGVATGAVLIVVAGLTHGIGGLATALIGVLAVVTFYGLGQWLEVVATDWPPRQAMEIVLVGYAVRVVGIGAALAAALGWDPLEPLIVGEWLAAAVVLTVLAWVTGVVVVGARQRVPVYDEVETPETEGEHSGGH